MKLDFNSIALGILIGTTVGAISAITAYHNDSPQPRVSSFGANGIALPETCNGLNMLYDADTEQFQISCVYLDGEAYQVFTMPVPAEKIARKREE